MPDQALELARSLALLHRTQQVEKRLDSQAHGRKYELALTSAVGAAQM